MTRVKRFSRTARRCVMRWLAHAGPQGLLIILLGLAWPVLGIATIEDYAGRPTDAPHLLVPREWRGSVWIITGLIAVALAVPRWNRARSITGREHRHALGLVALVIMPAIRTTSYFWAWVMSWDWLERAVQAAAPDSRVVEGAPSAYYGGTIWLGAILLVVCAMWAPRSWTSLRQALERDDAIERAATREETVQ